MTDLVTGDTGSTLTVTCKDGAGAVINLTGATVELHWEGASGTVESRNMTVSAPATGVAAYTFSAGEIFAPAMAFEVEITDSAGKVVTCTEKIELTAREEIG